MIKTWTERMMSENGFCEPEAVYMQAEINELRAKLAAAETSANELRRAVAELIGADPETWPNHGNAPLAIAACVAMRQAELAALEAKLAALEATGVTHNGKSAEHWNKLAVARWQENQVLDKKLDVLAADAARWVYWRDYHGFSGYFDEGATASPESADIDAACDAACDAAMKRVQP